jgi:excisionase family DNA binding protein
MRDAYACFGELSRQAGPSRADGDRPPLLGELAGDCASDLTGAAEDEGRLRHVGRLSRVISCYQMRQALGFASEEPTAAVFVRVPVRQAEVLDRLSFELKRPKRAIISALLSVLESEPGRLVLGHADTAPSPADSASEVLDVEAVASFLGVDAGLVHELAERGELPGRKLGTEWRFARGAVLDWLSGR